MVFTIEPGLYDGAIGGFRHSDTVAVTEDGIEILTDYPRDLESLTIPGLTSKPSSVASSRSGSVRRL